jgi:hypothetical protein
MAASMKMAILWAVALCRYKFTKVSQVIAASIIRPMSHRSDDKVSTSGEFGSLYHSSRCNNPEDRHLLNFILLVLSTRTDRLAEITRPLGFHSCTLYCTEFFTSFLDCPVGINTETAQH